MKIPALENFLILFHYKTIKNYNGRIYLYILFL